MTQPTPNITTFGPHRVIGMSVVEKDSSAFKALWEEFIQRIGEIETSGDGLFFGLCRCSPGATDGSFEYVAAVSAKPDSAIPAGMTEAKIAGCTYAVFEVAGLELIGQAWQDAMSWQGSQTEWKGYCGSEGVCDCQNHPCFELYPPDFGEAQKLYIYLPIQKSA